MAKDGTPPSTGDEAARTGDEAAPTRDRTAPTGDGGSAFWLVKSEPDVYSLDALARDGTTRWDGIRNYQARNFLRQMKIDDLALFYHSNAEPPAVVGVARVTRAAYDEPGADGWSAVDLAFERRLGRAVPLADLKADPDLEGLETIRKGSRLSVHPVSPRHFQIIVRKGGNPG